MKGNNDVNVQQCQGDQDQQNHPDQHSEDTADYDQGDNNDVNW